MPTDRARLTQRIVDVGIIAIVRTRSPEGLVDACRAMADGGLTAVEITMTTPGALDAIGEAREKLGDDILVGVGSVVDGDTAREALNAGAQFIVSPVHRPAVVQAAHDAGAPAMPGALTPGEILDAWDDGADLVKVFPASNLGPGYFRDVLAPMPNLKLTPTGGVDLETAGDWIRAGATCLGVGSSLVRKDWIAEGKWKELAGLAQQYVQAVRAAREA